MGIGGRLVLFREARGLTQKQLAQEVGMPASQLSRYERGLERPRFRNVERLARGLMVPMTELFW